MDHYLDTQKAAEYLGVSTETIKSYAEKGLLPSYKLERAIRFKKEDLDNLLSLGVSLVKGLRAVVTHVHETAQGTETWRVIIQFENTSNGKVVTFGDKNNFTEYYVWVSAEYLEDFAKLPGSENGAERFALRYIKDRFEETADSNGDRDITKIAENSVVCAFSQEKRGTNLSLLPSKENGK